MPAAPIPELREPTLSETLNTAPPPPLPIDAALPALLAALEAGPGAVLAAPPGAGKTTGVPPALLRASWASGRILLLEPRRIAARAAAERMAATRGEPVGRTVGYRIRGETRISAHTRIEVVTEGILTAMLQSDPELPGVSAVLFDEVHERSIHTDVGLALALEVQATLRPELRLLAMSATLDTAAFARLMGGVPVIESEGRAHPVETRWLASPRPRGPRAPRLEAAAGELTLRALDETGPAGGDLLLFLPGFGEIERTRTRLTTARPDLALYPLHGSLPFARQAAALRPDPDGRRRVVLATAIAETSLTVAGVRIVVDAGRARRARTHPASGMGRLVTEPVSRAEADQRRGRAGREGPGICYRLWTRTEEGALPETAPPEMLTADLAPLALELAAWGTDAGALAFLDPPPAGALAEARALLADLGALDDAGRITPHGRRLARRPLHPRLAHMLAKGAAEGHAGEAALLAALLAERDPLPGAGADLAPRLAALAGARDDRLDRVSAKRIRAEACRLSSARAPRDAGARAGRLLAHAYPDRIALRRPGDAPRYLLSGGRGAAIAADDPLAGDRLLVAADLDDSGREARIRLAARLSEAELREVHGPRIVWEESAEWMRRAGRVEARQQEMLGRLALQTRIWRDVPAEALGAALAEGVREKGIAVLPWTAGARSLRDRVRWLAAGDGPLADRLPDWSEDALLARLDLWLTPYLSGMTRLEDLATLDLARILETALGADLARQVTRAAPAHIVSPLGSRLPIDYGGAAPMLRARVQEMFGLQVHPTLGSPPRPLLVELLSPAGRPVARTADLPAFWSGAYADMAKDMRAQYPRHPWPDAPATATPTRRAKPRKA